MKIVLEILGLILTAAWIEQVLSQRAARKRRERRGRELLAHVPGTKWWEDPPNDGPEGDY